MKTGVRKTLDGYQAWFKIDNQTFHLEECVEDTDEDSLEAAQFFEKMLKVAFKKLNIPVVVGQSEQVVICKKCGSSEMYQYTKTKDKCEDCGNIQDY